jgi:hypothetical protein
MVVIDRVQLSVCNAAVGAKHLPHSKGIRIWNIGRCFALLPVLTQQQER